jgi:hypothetical protein
MSIFSFRRFFFCPFFFIPIELADNFIQYTID